MHLANEKLVVDELVPDKQDKHTFSFVSPLVQRRTVDIHGNPLGEWATIDLAGERYYDLLRANGMRFEPESAELEPVCFEGLVMSKFELIDKDQVKYQYPEGERSLGELQKTLTAIANAIRKGSTTIKPKSPTDIGGFNPFKRPATTNPTGTNPMSGTTTTPMPGVKPPLPGLQAE